MQVLVISEVSSYWKNSTQMTAITIDRMMGYRLISNLAIVKWVFSEVNINQFHLTDQPWEILRNAINKTYNRISDLRKEIHTLDNGILLAEEAALKAKQEYETAESKLEILDGQPVQAEKPGRLKRLKGYAERAKDEENSIRESREMKDGLLLRALEENKITQTTRCMRTKMTLDTAETPKMDIDLENGVSNNGNDSGVETAAISYETGEHEQWCLTTLGHVKAISRQYAAEIWPHIEILDAEVFTEDIHPLYRKAVYDGLCRSTPEP
ncbi:hypothetical protein HPP92_006657 [Vanilla planifolia]|uniref:MIF4G-like type 2 domain-containing protein n=1 Tax=Vanilla planifolia TaxID=51239 RepID=A0A835RIT6_VANPL|nr:hypothetical protein HPP92_006657 [Vanilla planifolia]